MKASLIKILSWLIISSMIIGLGVVSAEPNATIDRDQPSSSIYEVNDGKIVKETILYLNGAQEIITYTYNAEGEINQSVVVVPAPSEGSNNGMITIQAEPLDVYIKDRRITDRIDAISTSWQLAENEYVNGLRSYSEKVKIQEQLHNLANLSRVDYIIMNPYSTYAVNKLGGNSNFPLNRNLSYNSSNPISGFDVLVIQRVLELYGYIDFPEEDSVFGGDIMEAVKLFQASTSGLSITGNVDAATYHALFNSGTSNVRGLGALSQINYYRQQHDLVQQAVIYQLRNNRYNSGGLCTTSSGVCAEVSVPGGSVNGGTGRADIVDKKTREVWEVKPDNNRYNENASATSKRNGAVQLQRYIIRSANTVQSYFPLRTGRSILPISIDWSTTKYLYVRPGGNKGPMASYQSGMVYYSAVDKSKTPTTQPVPVPKANENKVKQTAPDIETVAVAAGAIGAGYVTYRVGKAVIGILLIPVSGPGGLAIILTP
ncbi:peptidoglycan-binding protein [Paenibacillus yanchengensis]|uniref:Peptidoglycan-binding protein n=1 Tax=Paenibacillus yanchengensis TaxID=2035833 RepID=A0ABW4YIU0_9BACL